MERSAVAEAGEGSGEIDGVGSVGGEWRLACTLRVVQPTGVGVWWFYFLFANCRVFLFFFFSSKIHR